MNNSVDIEKQVMDWYQKNWNKPVFPFFRRPVLTMETSLSTGEYPWANVDAQEILESFFSEFRVEKRGFSFIKYWPNEETFMPLNFLRPKNEKWHRTEPVPLTLKMLVESAKAGHWLYD
ncbi:DUF1493 family protein [Pluralibacter sp.]|jgi:hypothetical protein|uniref:DUF1493 family protein n=1 Tax=Pluralibacter sp. TaxID=1920032 RepID=UPI0025D727DF|nr:DUF1493 family protein [Pluralibacter sp.]MBV8041919.1 DUF1493 family protein [Pluralibacter sp.]